MKVALKQVMFIKTENVKSEFTRIRKPVQNCVKKLEHMLALLTECNCIENVCRRKSPQTFCGLLDFSDPKIF